MSGRSTRSRARRCCWSIIGVVFWIGWHVYQMPQENAEIEDDLKADRSGDETRKAIDRY